MNRSLRLRFWMHAALATLCAGVLVLTLVSQEWVEALFGVDPDGGSGTLELALLTGTLLATLAFSVAARSEWRRAVTVAAG